jgi:hypothetical protein
MHGHFSRSLDEKLVDKEQSYRWLKFGDIKGETESTVVQLRIRQSAQTTLREILKEEIESRCGYVKNTKKLLTT